MNIKVQQNLAAILILFAFLVQTNCTDRGGSGDSTLNSGRHSVSDLEQWVLEVEASVNATRREKKGALIGEVTLLVSGIQTELAADRAGLNQAKAAYQQRFSPAARAAACISGLLAPAAYGYRRDRVEPREAEVNGDMRVDNLARGLLDRVKSESQAVEVRTSYHRGVCGVYNERTGKTEWKERFMGGVAGVYNPSTGRVEWRNEYQKGVGGAYNPNTKQVEWKSEYLHGFAGVYNPSTGVVEWRTAYEQGVAGVYNPRTKLVEWKVAEYNTGIAGAFNMSTGEVEWHTAPGHGVATVFFDGKTYRSSFGYAPIASNED